MRVALAAEQLLDGTPGGIGRYVAELARRLPARDVEVVAFTARHPRRRVDAAMREFELAPMQPVVLSLPRPVLYDSWHVLNAFSPVGKVGDVDLVHAPSLAVPPTRGIPLVVTAHDAVAITAPETLTRRGAWFHRRGLAAAATRADLVITATEASAADISANTAIARARLRIVPHGVDVAPASEREIQRTKETIGLDDRPYVLWVGTVQPRKNLGVLVDAFARAVDATDLPHRLVLAGADGWLADDPGALRGLGDRARVLGRVPEVHLNGLYAGAAAFGFPSRDEGFGLPVLEAMAQDTPVVCSDIPVLREVVGDAARLAPPDDVDAWSRALTEVLMDEQLRADLVARGRERVVTYSWDRCADETAAVYREVLDITSRH